MLRDYNPIYRSKLRTPDEAVRIVKNGDWVDYTSNIGKPVLLDQALARRRDELVREAEKRKIWRKSSKRGY